MEYSVVIFEQEQTSAEVLNLYFEEYSSCCLKSIYKNYTDGYESVKSELPDIVIINLNKNPEFTLDLITKISNLGCKVIATSSDFTAKTVIKSLRAGASEFLPNPIIKSDLFTVLDKLCSNEKISETKCRILTVFSNKGGIGKTAIATNLAVELAKITKEKVALLDLNLQLGDISNFLDIKPTFDISYVVNNTAEKDENFLLSTFEQYKDLSLYVLAEPSFAEKAHDIKPEQLSVLFESLRKTFSYVIIDMSTIIDEKSTVILDNSDIILFTTIINLPAIRNCQRCLELFNRMGYDETKTKVVVNRYVENDEITADDVETVLNKSIYWKIPNNYFTIMSAINKGLPVSDINADSNITNSFRELAVMLSDSIIKQNITERVISQSN